MDVVYHFHFGGEEDRQVTISIKNQTLTVEEGHQGKADLIVNADTRTWINFIRKETHIVSALVRRKIRIKGNPKLLLAFGKCFLA